MILGKGFRSWGLGALGFVVESVRFTTSTDYGSYL